MVLVEIFIISFLAATLLPLSSEIVLFSFLMGGGDPFLLWLCATIGNVLGAYINWLLGRFCIGYVHKSWFPFSAPQVVRSQRYFDRYGKWSLLFSWVPIIGDALTFFAGTMRTDLRWFIVLVALGKGLRYAVVIVLFVLNFQ